MDGLLAGCHCGLGEGSELSITNFHFELLACSARSSLRPKLHCIMERRVAKKVAKKPASVARKVQRGAAGAACSIPKPLQPVVSERSSIGPCVDGLPTVIFASDCSGLCTEHLAVKLLLSADRCNVDYAWIADKNAAVHKLHKHLFKNLAQRIIRDDLTTRDYAKLASEAGPIDCYHAGFPCPAFSIQGNRRGALDERAGGNVFLVSMGRSPKDCRNVFAWRTWMAW